MPYLCRDLVIAKLAPSLFSASSASLSVPPMLQSNSAGSLLEEVIFAVDAFPAAEAALSQRYVAVTALETLAVPMSVQSLKDEAVQDVLITASTHRDLCGYKNNPGHGTTKMGDGPFTGWNQLAELQTSRAAHLPLQAIQGNRRILYPAAPPRPCCCQRKLK